LLEYGILASKEHPFDPMEKAFHALGQVQLVPGTEKHGRAMLKFEYGLRPELLAVTHVWDNPESDRLLVAAKGAPEAIGELCRFAPAERDKMKTRVDDMAHRRMRVLAVARASADRGEERPASPRGFEFEFLGLVGLADPLRPTVPDAVGECRAAGIRS